MKILLIEDDQSIAFGLKTFLKQHNYQVHIAHSLNEAYRLFSSDYSLFIIDINLPDGNGLDFAQTISPNQNIPILFLSAKDDETTIVSAFDLGAADYITKPFYLKELLRRIQVIMKQQHRQHLYYHDIHLDLEHAQVFVQQQEIILSVLEYKLLLIFIQNPNQLFLRQHLLTQLWEMPTAITDNTLSVNIKRLRTKMGPSFQLQTIHGQGYILNL